MHARTLPSKSKKVHTNSEYINFQNMSFYWHKHWLTAVTSLARGEYLSPSCHRTRNFNYVTEHRIWEWWWSLVSAIYYTSTCTILSLLLLRNIYPNISITHTYRPLLNFKTFLTRLTSIMNKNYLFVQRSCISTAAKPFTLCAHKLFFPHSQNLSCDTCYPPQNLGNFPQSLQANSWRVS